MFKKLAKQLKEMNAVNSNSSMTSPIELSKSDAKVSYLKNMSEHALDLYERKTDVNNFKRLVLSDPENTSHNELVDKLFEDSILNLSENERFLKDLDCN